MKEDIARKNLEEMNINSNLIGEKIGYKVADIIKNITIRTIYSINVVSVVTSSFFSGFSKGLKI